MQQRRREAGFTSLVGVLVAMAVMLVLMAALLPASLRLEQVNNESAAAEKLAQIGAAESAAQQLYQQYMTLDRMGGTISMPSTCINPNLLSGAQTQAPAGYVLVGGITGDGSFSGTPASPGSGCVNGAAQYVLEMKPISPLEGQRWFAMAEDGIVHFANNSSVTSLVRTQNGILQISVISENVNKFLQVTGPTAPGNPPGSVLLSPISGSANVTFNQNQVYYFPIAGGSQTTLSAAQSQPPRAMQAVELTVTASGTFGGAHQNDFYFLNVGFLDLAYSNTNTTPFSGGPVYGSLQCVLANGQNTGSQTCDIGAYLFVNPNAGSVNRFSVAATDNLVLAVAVSNNYAGDGSPFVGTLNWTFLYE